MTPSIETPSLESRGFLTRLIGAGALALTLAACGSPGPRNKPAARPLPAAAPVEAPATKPASTADLEDGVLAANRPKGDPDQIFQEALRLMKERKFPEAQNAFIALSRDYPAFSGPLTDLGILYAQGEQHELALSSLSRAVKANPGNEVAHNWLGTLYRENGEPLRAEQSYRNAIAARPGYAQAHLNLAILYDVVLHRPREALVSYRDYQRFAGDNNLIVAAWIREIEGRLQTLESVQTTTVAEAVR
ncbi:MAG: tetratricopeptide repeat protein [Panacagrimonas sp.]